MTYYVKVKAFSDDPSAGDVPYRDVETVEGYEDAAAIVDRIAEPMLDRRDLSNLRSMAQRAWNEAHSGQCR